MLQSRKFPFMEKKIKWWKCGGASLDIMLLEEYHTFFLENGWVEDPEEEMKDLVQSYDEKRKENRDLVIDSSTLAVSQQVST